MINDHKQTAQPDKGPSRVLSIPGVHNFRDLGGYSGVANRRVKWGCLYRSGHFGKLKRSGFQRFENLRIHTLIDFRSTDEQEKDPNRLPDSDRLDTLALPILDPAKSAWAVELKLAIQANNLAGLNPSQKMAELYQGFPVDYPDEFKDFTHTVLQAQGQPVVWHCTAGKDRTGFAAAIILKLLGVQQDVIESDYLISKKYADQRKLMVFYLRLIRGKAAAEMVRGLMQVQVEWLRAAFQSIQDHWGSFESFSRQALRLTDADINQLRNDLLES